MNLNDFRTFIYYVTSVEFPIGQSYRHHFETFFSGQGYTYTLLCCSNSDGIVPVLPVGLNYREL
jgi:hypothetical protein